ncbi:hypothetical protein E4U19_001568 [Claviceps sp. Clav32 group G5]|nr:hypothetical protein E4U19_001568 [Claviceps sp. Clav32 group G5]
MLPTTELENTASEGSLRFRNVTLRYVPRYRSDPEHPTYSEYVTWEDAFYHLWDRYPRWLRFDYIDEIPTLEKEIDEFEAVVLGEESNDAYFQELLDAGLGKADSDDLGSRPLDLAANWDAYVGKYSEELPDLLLPTAKDEYWKSLKASTSINLDYGTEASNAEASLNPEQRLLFKYLSCLLKCTQIVPLHKVSTTSSQVRSEIGIRRDLDCGKKSLGYAYMCEEIELT